jgi:tetratricopeptide (TPR) repeat protein
MHTPVARNVAWLRAIPLGLVVALLSAVFDAIQVFQYWAYNVIAAFLVVVGYRYLIRYTVMRHLTNGVRLLRAQRYEEAIPAFERNLDFFDKHPTVDKWRSILFLSAARYGYMEMTLLNLGLVYSQIREGERSEEYYKKALELNPKNGAAVFALNLLNAKLKDPDVQAAP